MTDLPPGPRGAPTEASTLETAGSRSRRLAAVALLLALAVAFLFREDVVPFVRNQFANVPRLGVWGPVLFVTAYVLGTVLFLPGSILTLGAGAAFGVVQGTVYVSLGSTLGATAAFLIGRHLARDWVKTRAGRHGGFDALDRSIAVQGWRIVLLARLSPAIPFNLLNYALGLTRISLHEYVLASWLGMLPATVVYVYLGSLARSGVGSSTRSPAEWALYLLGLAATVAVTFVVTRMARKALATSAREQQANL